MRDDVVILVGPDKGKTGKAGRSGPFESKAEDKPSEEGEHPSSRHGVGPITSNMFDPLFK